MNRLISYSFQFSKVNVLAPTFNFFKLEKAYETIEKEYENLTAQKERQDNLEKAARMKMEQQIARCAES